MPAWNIDPAGVSNVLTRTETVAAELDGHLRSLNTGLEGAAGQSSSTIVAQALQGFATSVGSDVTFVVSRIGACMSGAAQATNAYVQGDLQMAADAQSAAAGAPDPTGLLPRGRYGPR